MKMIYKLLYYWFYTQTRFKNWISKNIYCNMFINYYRKIYNEIKNIVYQIPEEPFSKKWCNTIAIYRPYYLIEFSSFSNIFNFLKCKFSNNWIIFENLIEFEEDIILTINYQDEKKKKYNLSIVEAIEAKKTVDIVKKKYYHLSDPCLKYNLFILKNGDYYYTQIIYQSNIHNLFLSEKNSISNINFMAVEYVHPSLKTPLLIDLSYFKFAVKSHILGFLFIYWYLRNKYGNWTDCIFDMNYKLNIIDSDLHYFEISPMEFITLDENNYKVERIFSLITGTVGTPQDPPLL